MKTIILAAGRSQRFKDEGFAKPKGLLPMPDGESLLERQFFALHTGHCVLVVHERDVHAYLSVSLKILVRSRASVLFETRAIQRETKGPLDTLWEVRQELAYGRPFTIVYSDVLPLSEKWMKDFQDYGRDKSDARMAIFESDDPRFSDVPDMPGYKESGIYWFRSGHTLVSAMRKAKKGENNGIPDMVHAYKKSTYVVANNDEIVDLGVPRDYRVWMAENGNPIDENWKPWR